MLWSSFQSPGARANGASKTEQLAKLIGVFAGCETFRRDVRWKGLGQSWVQFDPWRDCGRSRRTVCC